MTRRPMVACLLVALAASLLPGALPSSAAATHFVVVEGLGGTLEFSERFRNQVEAMLPALRRTAGDDSLVHVLAGTEATGDRVRAVLEELRRNVAPGDAVAVFLIGHGTHDGRHYKFNIPGPDFTATQLKGWLDAVPAARQLVVSTTSASGGALEPLKSPRRVVVTATKNGRERNATVFGDYWAEAFSAPSADTDKNEAVSALEAFRYAEGKVKAHYADSKRLATEHPQIQGERAGGFVLARLGAAAALARDPEKRQLLNQREQLERRIADLTLRKDDLPQDEYLDALQALLLELADLQERIAADGGPEDGEEP